MILEEVIHWAEDQQRTWVRAGDSCNGPLYKSMSYNYAARWGMVANELKGIQPFNSPRTAVPGDILLNY